MEEDNYIFFLFLSNVKLFIIKSHKSLEINLFEELCELQISLNREDFIQTVYNIVIDTEINGFT